MLVRFLNWIRRKLQRDPEVRFAQTERVCALPALCDDFIERVLGFARTGPVFISDFSFLHDFGDDAYVAQLREKVKSVYGVDVSDLEDGRICEILERVSKQANQALLPTTTAVTPPAGQEPRQP